MQYAIGMGVDMKAKWIGLLALLLATERAHGLDYYCGGSRSSIHDGGEYQVDWQVVNSNARRVQMPGQTKPARGCTRSWQSLGAFYRPPAIIQAPKLGRARIVSNYRIYYESGRSGQDTLGVRIHWIQFSSGQLQSAVVRYNITVTDKPL
jgi:hypothetical protein